MKFKECCALIKADLDRCCVHDNSKWGRFRSFFVKLIGNESFMITFWFRLGGYLKSQNSLLSKFLLVPVMLIFKWNKYLTGIQLLTETKIGAGLKFFHYNCIVIAGAAIIGKNVSIHQGVTIGRIFVGKNAGVPKIGNNVVIMPLLQKMFLIMQSLVEFLQKLFQLIQKNALMNIGQKVLR